jgi:hypothetical protein
MSLNPSKTYYFSNSELKTQIIFSHCSSSLAACYFVASAASSIAFSTYLIFLIKFMAFSSVVSVLAS